MFGISIDISNSISNDIKSSLEYNISEKNLLKKGTKNEIKYFAFVNKDSRVCIFYSRSHVMELCL